MIKNPKHTIIGEEVYDDIIELIHDMDETNPNSHHIEIEIISLIFIFEKWTYFIKRISNNNKKSYVNFYTSERHHSLDNKIEQYLDKHMNQITRDEKLNEIGI